MKKTFITLSVLVLLSILGVTLLFWLLSAPMAWYVDAERASNDATIAEQAEFRLVEEFHKVRPDDEVWKLRIQDAAVNAWLTHRLTDWLTHEEDLEIPEGMALPLLQSTPSGIWFGVKGVHDEVSQPVALFCAAEVNGETLLLTPEKLRLGKIPLPLSMLASMIDEPLDVSLELDAQVALMDDRIVQIQALDLESGSIILTCKTVLP